ncbi:hypothetical protein [Glutamicibacter protophormiae]|uniref:Uncharacterized protein Yka (UPF0111/DUF47 family) n=1 Tax=Glutamicibacter protophormiae TaxID=37930 RepID=A0ABS4XNI2_GLUPR|nr:hypothetical protein [Glutamicibacter protophormiae]MBP2398081.1 uncharacterized protein Yka (UPF0111/DUF47 family) [Glutamicibacter protophormiae]QRQ78821.1 hypothetical protein JQN66_00665 [Glutamicibacter protophormiae]WPR64883.1 hypothetical protein SLW72_00650 [Glutamicibacter protophormiae]WPR68379.1 hypothetical protein SLW73_00650 [Glutamicibacter protophormiae]GGL99928.1 hypothetical protein GCM10010038_32460 [Glutamicibacter protophormiae]
MKFQIFPSASRGIELLRDLAATIRRSVASVSEMIGNPEGRPQQLRDLATAEAEASDLVHAVLTHLRTSYISPLPREDMYTLSRLLHETMEQLRGTGELIMNIGSTPLSERSSEQLELISQLADLASDSVQRLNNLDDLEDNWLQMVQSSKRAARTHLVWVDEIATFSKASTIHRHQRVADHLMLTANTLRQFADHLGRVLVKES